MLLSVIFSFSFCIFSVLFFGGGVWECEWFSVCVLFLWFVVIYLVYFLCSNAIVGTSVLSLVLNAFRFAFWLQGAKVDSITLSWPPWWRW